MSESRLSESSLLDEIVEKFLEERDQGAAPDQSAYLRKYPELAIQLREIFSGLAILAGSSESLRKHADGSPRTGLVIEGKYRLNELIGSGGMGQVWSAQQLKGIIRPVAIKLIKAGMDSERVLARFEVERQALAMMSHPNIAIVLDAGITETGRPYFAMEFVQGVPITEYCDQNRISIIERLKLFATVCDAVHHSHQRGIIHRDLKPSNILVCVVDNTPVAKVIDFGLAKAMDQTLPHFSVETGVREFVGTPHYTSPEQAERNNAGTDVRSDVYALGVILYELLVGTKPLDKLELKGLTQNEALRQIREVDPPRPSIRFSSSDESDAIAWKRVAAPEELSLQLARELDWIVMRALEKDKSRRYQSAREFEDDIGRYLRGEPVVARPPSKLYTVSKFVRRNRGVVGSAAAVLVGIAVIVAWMSVDLYRRRALEQRISVSQIEFLRAAEAKSFSRRLKELKAPEYATFVSQLHRFQRLHPPRNAVEQRRDSLVRLSLLGTALNESIDEELVKGTEADEILAINASLKQLPPHQRSALRKLLDSSLKGAAATGDERLKLLGILCQVDQDALSDPESLDELASRLCDVNAIELPSWRTVFQPLSDGLVTRFEQIIDDSDAGKLRRSNAASFWVSYRSEHLQDVVKKGLNVPSVAYEPFVANWTSNRNRAIELLKSYLIDKPNEDATAELFVGAAIGLANLGELDHLWECFSGSLGESVRARAITLCQPRLIPFETLAGRILLTKSSMERASIIAALSTYPVDQLRKGINQSLIEVIQREFLTNPSSSVHGACESTLVRWKVSLPTLDASPEIPSEGQRWYRSPTGIDFVTLDIPALDSMTDAAARPGYCVAVGSREVTVAQFLEFLNDETNKEVQENFRYKVEVSPEGDCPQNSVNWYVGAMYCNWLSLKEGIAPDQLCFEADRLNGGAPRRKENAESLGGYRFPSVAEAKLFCGGINPPFDQARPKEVSVMSNFPWGHDTRLLNDFAHTAQNAMGRTWPAGHRLPNDLGMHDTLGSLLEWTVTVDEERSMPVSTGGNYINAKPSLFYVEPQAVAGFNFNNFYLGFRVARTLDIK